MTHFLFLALVGSSSWFSSVAMANSGSSLLITMCNKTHTHKHKHAQKINYHSRHNSRQDLRVTSALVYLFVCFFPFDTSLCSKLLDAELFQIIITINKTLSLTLIFKTILPEAIMWSSPHLSFCYLPVLSYVGVPGCVCQRQLDQPAPQVGPT